MIESDVDNDINISKIPRLGSEIRKKYIKYLFKYAMRI